MFSYSLDISWNLKFGLQTLHGRWKKLKIHSALSCEISNCVCVFLSKFMWDQGNQDIFQHFYLKLWKLLLLFFPKIRESKKASKSHNFIDLSLNLQNWPLRPHKNMVQSLNSTFFRIIVRQASGIFIIKKLLQGAFFTGHPLKS